MSRSSTPESSAIPLLNMDIAGMEESAIEAVILLKGLANERRLLIMCILAEGELSVNQLNERLALSQSALSQHLAVLREQGLVDTRRDGQTIYYRLAESPALAVIKVLHDQFCSTG